MGSVRRRGGAVRVTLTSGEVELLVWLAGQVVELLDEPAAAVAPDPPTDPPTGDPLEELLGDTSQPVAAPTDPVVRRLLPDAYRDDEAAAQEFRRFTDGELRAGKRDGLLRIVTDVSDAVQAAGPGADKVRVDLGEQAVVAWLPALTDVRLALGTRLDVGEDTDAERVGLAPGSRRYAELATYDWLAWLQESLVRALSRG